LSNSQNQRNETQKIMKRSFFIPVFSFVPIFFGKCQSFIHHQHVIKIRTAAASTRSLNHRSSTKISKFDKLETQNGEHRCFSRHSNLLQMSSYYEPQRDIYDDDDFFDPNPRLSKDLDLLRYWIKENGGDIFHVDANELPPTNNDFPQGWELQASANITKGETLVRIPKRLCIHPDEKATDMELGPWQVLEELDSAIKEQAPEELCRDGKVRLALAVLSERTKEDSFYYPYISNLPATFKGFPVFFNVTELNSIEDQQVINAVKERCSFLLRFTSNALRHLPHHSNDPFHGFVIDANVLGWAIAAATSRGFEIEPGKKVMIPFIDLANHNFRPNAQIRLAGEGDIELCAIKDISAGEPVTVSYGSLTNNDLLLNYGFTCWPNPYDRIGIDFGQKMLQAARILLNIQNEPFGNTDGDQDEIAAWQLKKLLELDLEGFDADLKLEIGGPKIIDGRLLAALRILFAESYEELSYTPLKKLKIWSGNYSRRVERRAISTAIGICFILLRAFRTTIQEDELSYSGKYMDVDIVGKGDKTQVFFMKSEVTDTSQISSVPNWMYGGKDSSSIDDPIEASDPGLLTWEMKEAIKYRILKKQLVCETIARLYGKLEVIGAVGGEQDLIECGGEYFSLEDED